MHLAAHIGYLQGSVSVVAALSTSQCSAADPLEVASVPLLRTQRALATSGRGCCVEAVGRDLNLS